MEQHNALIEQLKQEVRRKAIESCVPFDPEDIQCHELYGHYIVALMKIKRERQVLEDGVWITLTERDPNIWLEYPSPALMTLDLVSRHERQISLYSPKVSIKCPWLVYLVYPDGTYKPGGLTAEFLGLDTILQ